eukprot:2424954-Rhodomonas_salina.1
MVLPSYATDTHDTTTLIYYPTPPIGVLREGMVVAGEVQALIGIVRTYALLCAMYYVRCAMCYVLCASVCALHEHVCSVQPV